MRQTYGDQFLEFYQHLNFLKNFHSHERRSAHLRHKIALHDLNDVIVYPHPQELFAISKSDVEDEIDRQNFGVDFELKQIRKRCCKNNVVNYNAIPSLNKLIAITEFAQRPVWNRLKVY